MRKHHLTRAAALVLVLTAAAVLVPTPAAAHARPLPYHPPHEYATARTAAVHLMPALNRGTIAARLDHLDLDLLGRRA